MYIDKTRFFANDPLKKFQDCFRLLSGKYWSTFTTGLQNVKIHTAGKCMICSGYAQAEEDSLTPASWWVTGTSSFKSKHNRGPEKPDFTPRIWTCPLIQGRHEWGIWSHTPEWNKTPECCTVVMYTLMAPSRKILVKEQLVELTAGSVSSAEPLCLCSCQSLGSSKALARGYWGITLSMNLWALHYSTVIACFWLLQHFLHVRILPSQLSFAHLLGAGKEQLVGYSKSFSALFPCRDLLNPSLFCEKVTAPTGSVITDNCSWCSSQSFWKPQPKKASPLAINYPVHLQCEPRGWKH